MSKKTLHYVIHSCGPQECDCSAVCNPREGDEIQITTNASQVTCGNCLRVMAKRKVPLASDQVARLQGPKSICDALQQQVEVLEAKNQRQLEEINILNGQLDKFRSQSHGMPALAEIERMRAALHSCAKASSAAEVGVIVDGAIAASQAQQALAPENQRVVPVEPVLAPRHPLEFLAADHKGMRVDYSGLLKQSCRALRLGTKELGLAELLSQLHGHMTELGQRWYRGDTAVVDELLQLYAVEDAARDALKKAQGGDK